MDCPQPHTPPPSLALLLRLALRLLLLMHLLLQLPLQPLAGFADLVEPCLHQKHKQRNQHTKNLPLSLLMLLLLVLLLLLVVFVMLLPLAPLMCLVRPALLGDEGSSTGMVQMILAPYAGLAAAASAVSEVAVANYRSLQFPLCHESGGKAPSTVPRECHWSRPANQSPQQCTTCSLQVQTPCCCYNRLLGGVLSAQQCARACRKEAQTVCVENMAHVLFGGPHRCPRKGPRH